MKTIKALINFIKDYNNDLQGMQRQLLIDNLDTIQKKQQRMNQLLEMVVEEFEDEFVTQSTINQIKVELS